MECQPLPIGAPMAVSMGLESAAGAAAAGAGVGGAEDRSPVWGLITTPNPSDPDPEDAALLLVGQCS